MELFTTNSSTISSFSEMSDSSSVSSFSTDSSTITGPNGTSDSSSWSSMTSNAARRKFRALMEGGNVTGLLPPICTVDFHNPDLHTYHAEVSTQGAWYNSYYENSWLLHFCGFSNLQVTTDITKDPTRSYSLDLVHLSSLVNGQPLSKITITVNGQVVKTNYNPNNGNYFKDSFDITSYVVDGENTVQISLDADALSNYWIQSLAIQAK